MRRCIGAHDRKRGLVDLLTTLPSQRSLLNMQKQFSLFPDQSVTPAPILASRTLRPERLPTNTTTAAHPVHRWFNFIAGFSPEFVDIVCRTLPADASREVLLDPFAGCGTALVVAATKGMTTIGYEAHPVFEKICRAKLPGSDALNQLEEIETAIVCGLGNPQPLSLLGEKSVIFLSKLLSPASLGQLLGARQELSTRNLVDEPLAFLILSKALELSSHSATDGIYKAPTTTKRSLTPIRAARETCDVIRDDLEFLSCRDLGARARIFGKSSESMTEISDRTISIVVTSPPYLNNFDYAEMTRMHLYFWGIASTWGEITEKVRSRLIVNTTTALNGHKQRQDAYRGELPRHMRRKLDKLVHALSEKRKIKAGKKEYYLLVYPYFAQMTRVLRECYRVMEADAPMHIMVADSALYGIDVSTHEFLASILSEIGFTGVVCNFVRPRGHRWILEKREGSKNGLGEYHIRAKR